VGRASRHHHKGEVYRAVLDLDIPGKNFRVRAEGDDLRTSLDAAKSKLKILVEKYKEREKSAHKK
jgi:ribosome-associated translation inhibitor RaiA